MITTIIFDFAGVLTTSRCFPKIAQTLGAQYQIDSKLIEQHLYNGEDRYLVGKESTEVFWERTCKDLGITLEDFIKHFQGWYELNEPMMNLLDELSNSYELLLHSDNFEPISNALKSNQQLQSLFKTMVFSNEIELPKIDPEAFKHTLSLTNSPPEQCLFIDDKEKNLVAPRSLAIHTILYTSFEDFKLQLQDFIQ